MARPRPHFRKLAERQIRIAYKQAEKETSDLKRRTKEGIETARINGKQIGQKAGNKLTVKKLKKGKTYFVRIRAFQKTANGKTYGSWSGVKKIKIKA